MNIPDGIEGALKARVLGQDVEFGEAWYNYLYPNDAVTGDAFDPFYIFEYPWPKHYNVFKTEASGFSIIQWFYDRYGGFENIPHMNVTHYFNGDGTEFIPEGRPPVNTFTLMLRYVNGRAYFLGKAGHDVPDEMLIRCQNENLNYYGIDDTNNFTDLTQTDYNAASLWFFKPVYYEGIDDRQDISNRGATPMSRENKYFGVLNGELNCKQWMDYNTSSSQEIAEECDLTRLHMSSWSPNMLIGMWPEYYCGPLLSRELGEHFGQPWGFYQQQTYDSIAFGWYDSANLPAEYVSPEEDEDWKVYPPTPSTPPGIIPKPEPDNPSGGTGGNNNPSKDGKKPDEDRVPHIPISDTGVAHLYAPTQAQLRNFNDALWDQTTIDYLHGMFTNDPFQAIISLAYYPMDFTSVEFEGNTRDYTGEEKNCVLGKREITTNGNKVPMVTLNEDIIVCDFGKCYIVPHKNTAMDFSPFTKIQLFMPYIGFTDIDPSDCIVPNSSESSPNSLGYIYLMYKINLFTGDICAYVYGKGVLGVEKLIGQFTGNCCAQLPVTGRDFSSFYSSIAGGVAKSIADLVSTAISSSGGPAIQRCGDFSKGSAIISSPYAFVLRSYPSQSMSNWDYYKELSGLPVNDCNIIGNYKSSADNQRFFQVESVNMSGFSGTDSEAQELEALLKEGVYI